MKDGFLPGVMLGVGIGVGLALLAPALMPGAAGSQTARPLAKRLVRTGLSAYDRMKESMGEVGELAEDLVAEVKAEMILERAQAAAAAKSTSEKSEA